MTRQKIVQTNFSDNVCDVKRTLLGLERKRERNEGNPNSFLNVGKSFLCNRQFLPQIRNPPDLFGELFFLQFFVLSRTQPLLLLHQFQVSDPHQKWWPVVHTWRMSLKPSTPPSQTIVHMECAQKLKSDLAPSSGSSSSIVGSREPPVVLDQNLCVLFIVGTILRLVQPLVLPNIGGFLKSSILDNSSQEKSSYSFILASQGKSTYSFIVSSQGKSSYSFQIRLLSSSSSDNCESGFHSLKSPFLKHQTYNITY